MNTQPPQPRRRRQSNPSPPVILPDEIITDILSRLTVKHLMKMKCVSKSWKSLISSDPIFIKLHLNRSAKNTFFSLVSYKYNISKENDEYCFVPFPVTSLLENRCINLRNDRHFQLNNKNCREVLGSCNGLVCLLGYSLEKTVLWLRFWNPATRALSDKLGYLYDVNYYWNSWRFVFGYDSSTDIYKVVALHNKGSNSTPEVSVFSLGDNVWRNIERFPAVPLQLQSSNSRMYGGVHFGCTVNWLAIHRIDPRNDDLVHRFVIISLDLGTETHTQLMTPLGSKKVAYVTPSVCVLRNSFYFYHDFNRTDFVIWKMTEFGNDKSWTQFLKFSYHDLRMNYRVNYQFRIGGPLRLILMPLHLSEDGDTLVFANNLQDQAILYNWRTNRVLKSTINDKICWFSIKDYVESLVSTS